MFSHNALSTWYKEVVSHLSLKVFFDMHVLLVFFFAILF